VPNRLRTALITMISVVWAVNFMMPLLRPTYKPPAEINLAFMGIVGLLTAGYRSNNGDARPAPSPQQAPPQYPEEPPMYTQPRKRAPAKKTPARRAPAKKTTAKKTTKKAPAKKAVKKQAPRKRGGR
jgi:hypothetical protein